MKKTFALGGLLGTMVLLIGCHHPDPQLAFAPRADAPLLVSNVTYTPVASNRYSTDILNQLHNELIDCGFDPDGKPACLDTHFEYGSGYSISKKDLIDGTIRLFSTFENKEGTVTFVLITSYSQDLKTTFQSAELDYISSSSHHKMDEIMAAYQNGTLEKVADLSSPVDPQQFAKDALAKETSLRKIFHLTQYLTRTALIDDLKQILSTLQNQTQLFAKSNNFIYQKAFLLLIRRSFESEKDFLINVAKQLITVPDIYISELAAITLAERNVVDATIYGLVKQSLTNTDSDLRVLALPVFTTIRTGLADEIIIIGFLGDPDSSVREAAYQAVDSKIGLSDAHVPAFRTLLAHSDWSVRKNTVRLLRKIISASANAVLISALQDKDSYVREEAKEALNGRPLSNQDLPNLAIGLGNSDWSIRLLVVDQIGRIHTSESAATLIDVIEDKDSYVRQRGFELLKSSILGDQHLPSLKKILSNIDWTIRKNAVELIGLILSVDASNALIQALMDNDSYVRSSANQELSTRLLSDQNLPSFDPVLKSSDWQIRQSAMKLIGKIFTDAATNLLIPGIADNDSDVRETANMVLESHNIAESHVTLLIGILPDLSWNVRKSAAHFLGKSASRRAYDSLIARLAIEGDSDVKREIQQSIDLLKKKLGL